MLSEIDFQLWCQTLNLPQDTRDLIDQIRRSEPARRVQGKAGNVSGFYPSRKMKRTIQFEETVRFLGVRFGERTSVP